MDHEREQRERVKVQVRAVQTFGLGDELIEVGDLTDWGEFLSGGFFAISIGSTIGSTAILGSIDVGMEVALSKVFASIVGIIAVFVG